MYIKGILPIIQGDTELIKWENGTLSLVIYTIGAWIILFILRVLFVASFSLYRECQDKITELQDKLHNRKARQAALDKLWELRKSGTELRNRANAVNSQETWRPWHAQYDTWRADILREMKAISINLHNWNEVAQTMDSSKMPKLASQFRDNDGLFTSNYMFICENLNRIDHYLLNEIFLEQQQYYVTR